MKLVEKIVYKDAISNESFKDVDTLVKDMETFKTEQTNYLFEMSDSDEVTVFANLYAFEPNKGETKRFCQVETATLDKKTNEIRYHGDNDGLHSYNCFNNLPVWTAETLAEQGVKIAGDIYPGYEFSDLYW